MNCDKYSHRRQELRRGLIDSPNALGMEKVDVWYLHGPNMKTLFEDTLRGIDELLMDG
jgi:aflatoxin B1 aldehyde reductase